jgi:hypothetical protein
MVSSVEAMMSRNQYASVGAASSQINAATSTL